MTRPTVPTHAQLRELYLLRAWVDPLPVQVLRAGGAKNGLLNTLLRNNIRDLGDLYPVYVAIRDHLVNGRMKQVTWAARDAWLPVRVGGFGEARAARVVEVYERWAATYPQQAQVIADNAHRNDVPARAKLMAVAYLRDGTKIGDIADMFGVTPERVRANLDIAGLRRDLRQLHEINTKWVQHWDSQPCARADAGLGPCEGHHEFLQRTIWGVPAGPWEIVCHRHAEIIIEMAEESF